MGNIKNSRLLRRAFSIEREWGEHPIVEAKSFSVHVPPHHISRKMPEKVHLLVELDGQYIRIPFSMAELNEWKREIRDIAQAYTATGMCGSGSLSNLGHPNKF